MSTTYHVLDEDTLVHSTHRPGTYQVMARKVTSAHHNWDLIQRQPHELRDATQADFDNFRVCSKYHLKG